MTRSHRIFVALIVLATIATVAVGTMAFLRYVESKQEIAKRFDACTLPGPQPPPHTGHDCYDRGVQATANAVHTLQLRQGCIAASLAHLPDPPACTAPKPGGGPSVDDELREQLMIPPRSHP